MSGVKNEWHRVVKNIRELSRHTYVTVGIVLSEENVSQTVKIICLAHELGVADIRFISAAQYNVLVDFIKDVPDYILRSNHPILNYRIRNLLEGRNVRGIQEYDSHRCYLAIDDSVVCGGSHFPCVIYMREGGQPIGKVGKNNRAKRIAWSHTHDTHEDPICQKNCLDVCIDHNNYCAFLKGEKHSAWENIKQISK